MWSSRGDSPCPHRKCLGLAARVKWQHVGLCLTHPLLSAWCGVRSKRSSRSGEWRAEGAVGSRRGAGAGSSRSRRRTASEKPEWADFEEEENENEKSSTWSWVNSDATRGGGGRSRGRVVGTVVRGRYEDDDEEEEEGEIW